jgi:hypothetical protein
VEFGLRLDAEAGAVFAKAGIGAHFTITLNWDRATEHNPVATAPDDHPAPQRSP